LTDLNDFITPSQACIKPVETKNMPPPDPNGLASVRLKTNPNKCEIDAIIQTLITVDSSGVYHEVEMETNNTKPTSRKLEKAEISLNDCLACR
jgi:hypothetical protein